MNKGAVNYIARLMADRIIGAVLFWLVAGSMDTRAAIYFAVYIIVAAVSCVLMYKWNPQTLAERGKVATDSPKWDKVLLLLFWVSAYFIVYFAAGKTVPQNQAVDINYILGIVFYLFSAYITVYAMKENTFLESTARLQKDREQKVIQTGPYSVVRHPTYSAILIWCLAIRMIFPSKEVFLIALFVVAVISIRTDLEDEMLCKGLEGYKEYAEKVKYRLIPFVW